MDDDRDDRDEIRPEQLDRPDRWAQIPRRELVQIIREQQETIAVQAASVAALAGIIAAFDNRAPAATAVAVLIGGTAPMGTIAISIDDTAGKASYTWTDDHGDTDAAAPTSADGSPITVVLASDNPAAATLAADAADATGKTFDITPVAEGSFNVTLTATDDQGAPAVFANGTPITAPPTPCQIVAGAADALEVVAVP